MDSMVKKFIGGHLKHNILDRRWIGDGQEMDRRWIGDGQEMDRRWIEDGQEMDFRMFKGLGIAKIVKMGNVRSHL